MGSCWICRYTALIRQMHPASHEIWLSMASAALILQCSALQAVAKRRVPWNAGCSQAVTAAKLLQSMTRTVLGTFTAIEEVLLLLLLLLMMPAELQVRSYLTGA